MEKLRAFLEVIKKYHFWILCGFIVLLTFGSWFWSTNDLSGRFTGRKNKIDGGFKTVKGISQQPDHPSDVYIKAIDLRRDGNLTAASEEVKAKANIKSASESLTSNVTKANIRLFNEQRSMNRLPPVYDKPEYQAEFEAAFDTVWNHKIEEIEKPPVGHPTNPDPYVLDVNYRNQYRDRIKDYFPKLFDMIERRTEVKDEGAVAEPRHGQQIGFGPKPGEDRTKHYEGIVDWNDAEKLMSRFDKWTDTPTTLQIMLAQEDLWVYEALLRVVRNTNNVGPDNEHYQKPASHKVARIKEILALEIGNEAVQSWTSSENSVVIIPVDAGGGGDAHTSAAQGPAQGPSPPTMIITSRAGAGYLLNSGGGQTASPLAGRYVDNNGKLLADSTQPNDEFRMMPIDMQLIIEQKDIPRLLIECANSRMRIDVRSVRILAQKPPPFDLANAAAANNSAGGGGSMGPSAADMASHGLALRGMGPRPGSTGHSAGAEPGYSDESADAVYPPVLVEIQGVIYIYNPPTGNPGAGEDNGQAGAPAGTPPPAGVPAATGTPAATGSPAASGAKTTSPAPAPAAGTPPPAGNPVPVPSNPAMPAVPTGPAPTVPPATTPAKGVGP